MSSTGNNSPTHVIVLRVMHNSPQATVVDLRRVCLGISIMITQLWYGHFQWFVPGDRGEWWETAVEGNFVTPTIEVTDEAHRRAMMTLGVATVNPMHSYFRVEAVPEKLIRALNGLFGTEITIGFQLMPISQSDSARRGAA